MGKAYNLDDYSVIEATLLHKVVSLILLGDENEGEDKDEDDEEKFEE